MSKVTCMAGPLNRLFSVETSLCSKHVPTKEPCVLCQTTERPIFIPTGHNMCSVTDSAEVKIDPGSGYWTLCEIAIGLIIRNHPAFVCGACIPIYLEHLANALCPSEETVLGSA